MNCTYLVRDELHIPGTWWIVHTSDVMNCTYLVRDELYIPGTWWIVHTEMNCTYLVRDELYIPGTWWIVHTWYVMNCTYLVRNELYIPGRWWIVHTWYVMNCTYLVGEGKGCVPLFTIYNTIQRFFKQYLNIRDKVIIRKTRNLLTVNQTTYKYLWQL